MCGCRFLLLPPNFITYQRVSGGASITSVAWIDVDTTKTLVKNSHSQLELELDGSRCPERLYPLSSSLEGGREAQGDAKTLLPSNCLHTSPRGPGPSCPDSAEHILPEPTRAAGARETRRAGMPILASSFPRPPTGAHISQHPSLRRRPTHRSSNSTPGVRTRANIILIRGRSAPRCVLDVPPGWAALCAVSP